MANWLKTPAALVNIEAEQALLGALLWDAGDTNPVGVAALVPPEMTAQHFHEPFHQRLYTRLDMVAREGRRFDPILSGEAFRGDAAFEEMGGTDYISTLLEQAPPRQNAGEYARAVLDLAVKRQLAALAREISEAVEDTSETGDDIAGRAASTLSSLRTTASTLRLVTAAEAVDAVLAYIDNPSAHAVGAMTGLLPLDEHLGPMLPGDLIVLGGRPGMGKSALAVEIATNVALSGLGVIEINGEMTVEQMWRRRMTAAAYKRFSTAAPAYSKIRKRIVEFNEREMLGQVGDQLRGLPIRSLKRTGLTLARLRGLVHRQVALWRQEGIEPGLLALDHVGLFKADGQHQSRVSEQTEISAGLKELAGDIGIPCLALAQLSRKTEERDDKRPVLSDLRDSGSWEQDADIVILTYREAYYAQREKEPKDGVGKAGAAWAEWDQRRRSPWIEAILAKVREGETGTKKLWAHMPTNTVLGASPDDDDFRFGGLL